MTTTLRGTWNYPTSTKFGAGRIVELAEHCRALGMRRPLLVTDAGLAAFRGGAHDGVIAFGDGSTLDNAKAVAMTVGRTRPMWDFEDGEEPQPSVTRSEIP
jgi:alcohol dehydrogenase class IV